MMDLINNQAAANILHIVKENQKNFQATLEDINKIFQRERNFIIQIVPGSSVVLLISGGLDSVIALSYIIEKFNVTVYPLSIQRGARAEAYELESVKYYVEFFKEKYPNKIKDLFVLNPEIPPANLKKGYPSERLNAIGHPLRNSTLQNYAVMYCVYLNAKYDEKISTVLTGSVGDDTTCPELSILSLRSQMLNVCLNLGDWNWQITSPLIDEEVTDKIIFKKDLILWAKEQNIPLNKTRTCTSGSEIADGTCNECQRRLKVFAQLGLEDEIEYQKR